MEAANTITFELDGKKYGFELTRDNKGKANSFVVQSKQTIPASFSTGSVGYENISPEKISPLLIVDDWREGFGADDYDGRYHDAEETDARFKGRILLGPKKLTSVALPASTTTTVIISNGGFETWPTGTADGDAATPTGWTNSSLTNGAIKCDDDNEHAGTYCLELVTGVDAPLAAYADMTMPFDTSMRGKVVTVTCWMKEATSGALSGAVYDGVDTTTTVATSTSMAQYTIVHTFNENATGFRIRFGETATSKTSWVDDVSITRADTPYGTCTGTVMFGSTLVAALGSTLVKSTDGATFTVVGDFGAAISDLCVYHSTLFIALGTANAYYYTTDLTTFVKSIQYTGSTTVSTTTTAEFQSNETAITVFASTGFTLNDYVRWEDEVCQVDGTGAGSLTLDRGEEGTTAAYHAAGTAITLLSSTGGAGYMANVSDSQFWITTGTNTMADTDDPTNDGLPFSTPYTLPNSSYSITSLLNDPEGYVYVGKQDMPYVLSGADVVTLAAELGSDASTAGVILFKWKDDVFIRTGVNKLYRYGTVIEDISPVTWAFGNPDYDEEIQAFCSDANYLYVFMDNGSDIILMAGRDEIVGSAQWVWHPLAKFTSNDIVSCVVSSVSGYPVIYALTDTASDGVLKFCCPQSYGDTNLETGYKYVSSGDHYTPWVVTNFDMHDKYWSELFVIARNFDGVTTIRVYYQLEGEDKTDTWHDLAYCDADTGVISTKVTTYAKTQISRFTIDNFSRKIRFKFSLATSDEYVSPVILSYVVYGRIENSIGGVSTDKKDISLSIACHGTAPQHSGPLMNRNVTGELSTLLKLKASTKALTFYGPDKITRKVLFKSDDFGYQPDGEDTFAVVCRLEEA